MKKEKNLMILATVMLVLIAINISGIVKADTLPKIIKEETIEGVTYVTLECEGVISGRTKSLIIAKDMLDTLDWESFRNVEQEVLNTKQGYSLSDVKFEVTDKDSDERYFYELGYTSEYDPLEERKIEKNTKNIKTGVETIETWSNNNLIEFADNLDLAGDNKIEISEKMSVKKVVSYEQKNDYLDVIIEKDGSLVEGRLENFGIQTNKEILRFESKDNSFILKQFVGSNLEPITIEAGLREGEITYLKRDDGEKINLQGLGIEEFGYNFIDKKIVGEIDGKIGLITISDESGEGKYTIRKGTRDLTTIEILGDGSIQKIQREEKTITSGDEEKTITERMWIDGNLIYAEINGEASYIPEGFGIKEVSSYNDDGSLNVVLDDNGNEIEGTLSKDKTLHYTSKLGGETTLTYSDGKTTGVSLYEGGTEVTTIWEDNNLIFHKIDNVQSQDLEYNFPKVLGIKSIYGSTVTLKDGTKWEMKEDGERLKFTNIDDSSSRKEILENDDGTIKIFETTGIGTDDLKSLELNENGEVVHVTTVGDNGQLEYTNMPFPIDKNLLTDGVIEKIKSGEYKDMKVEDGKITYVSPEPIENIPPVVTKTSSEVKSWKETDEDEGTTTITYGDGKSVTMRTEMFEAIKRELNDIPDFDEIKVESNTLTYTIKGVDFYNAVIEFNEDGTKKSKTYTKTNSDGKITAQTIHEFNEDSKIRLATTHYGLNEDGTYTKTEEKRNAEGEYETKITILDKDKNPINQLKTEIAGEAGVGVEPAKGSVTIDTDEIWSNKMGIKLKNVHKEDGVFYATLEDGSKGILLVDENKFVYEDSGNGITHTLQAIEGGSLLEYYNDESEDYGTIKISIDKKIGDKIEKETIIFDGIYDEGNNVIMKGTEKIAEIDKDGRILTDFNEEGIPQTIHYPASNEFFGTYTFGKVQKDSSEKIFLSGYEPVAFRTDAGDLIIIKTDDDGNRIYVDLQGSLLNENSAGVKEAKAMVTKSKIGPAFYAAVDGARGGIALSNLLNTWLDWDFMMGWRKKTDEFFSQTVIGRIISGKWEESVCHSKIEKIPGSIAVVNVNNIIGFAAHVEGERSAAITTNNETLYLYKITFGVNPQGMGNITFELLIDGNKVDLDGDGTADKIELEADKSYSGTGENAIVRYKDKIYEDVCLKFYNTKNLNAEFKNSLKDDKLCNKIVEEYISIGEISKPVAGSTTASGTSASDGW